MRVELAEMEINDMEITKCIERVGEQEVRELAPTHAQRERNTKLCTPARQTTARRAGTMDEKGIGNGRWVM